MHMIIDLNLKGKAVLVLGAGKQAEHRIGHLLQEQCSKIMVHSKVTASDKITQWAKNKQIILVLEDDFHNIDKNYEEEEYDDTAFISDHGPDLIIAATNDTKVNTAALLVAKSLGILAYRVDSYEQSDYAHPAIIRLDGGITVAISTGRKSPVISKYIRQKVEDALSNVITPHILAQIQIQEAARKAAKSTIDTQDERKKILDNIMSDKIIAQLIRDGQIQDAKKRAISMLGDKQ